MVEHCAGNAEMRGSNPAGTLIFSLSLHIYAFILFVSDFFSSMYLDVTDISENLHDVLD